jgi:diguanylate cyclase (GGDEF)-like protein
MKPNDHENYQYETILRKTLHLLGHKGLVLLITLASMVISVVLTFFITLYIPTLDQKISLLFASLMPLLIVPLVSWSFVGLLIKLEKMEREMRHLATYDALTTLLTRQAFEHDAQNWLNLTKREAHNIAIVLLDIDHFKKINDTYGHSVGDVVLKQLGLFLKQNIREIDIAGRIGGEEFAILFWNITQHDAIVRSQTILRAIEALEIPYDEHKEPLHITVSMGISFCEHAQVCQLPILLNASDLALYRAKNSGRNRLCVYEEHMQMPSQIAP